MGRRNRHQGRGWMVIGKCENLPSKRVEKCESNKLKSLQVVTAFLLQYRIVYDIVYEKDGRFQQGHRCGVWADWGNSAGYPWQIKGSWSGRCKVDSGMPYGWERIYRKADSNGDAMLCKNDKPHLGIRRQTNKILLSWPSQHIGNSKATAPIISNNYMWLLLSDSNVAVR